MHHYNLEASTCLNQEKIRQNFFEELKFFTIKEENIKKIELVRSELEKYQKFIQSLKEQIIFLEGENIKLSDAHDKNEEHFRVFSSNLEVDCFEDRITKHQTDIKDQLNTLDEFYKEKMKQYESDLANKDQCIIQLKDKSKQLNLQITNLEIELKNFKKPFSHKSVECNFIAQMLPMKESNFITKALSNTDAVYEGKIHNQTWMMFVINQIFNDKFIFDYYSQKHGYNKKNLNSFCGEWFLKSFGSKNVAFALFQDFILHLKEFSHLQERYSIFNDLISLEKGGDNENQHPKKRSSGYMLLEKSKNRKICYKTYYSCNFYFKIVKRIKDVLNHENPAKYTPNFPNLMVKNSDNIPMELGKTIIESYLLEIGYSTEKIKSILLKIDAPQEKMEMESSAELRPKNSKSQHPKTEDIKFDKLCRYLLDKTLESKIHDLEKLYTSIKLRKYSGFFNKMFTIDDYGVMIKHFHPNADIIFISSTFNDFIERITDASNDENGVFAILPWLLNEFKHEFKNEDDFNGTFSEVVEKKKPERGSIKMKIEPVVVKTIDEETKFLLENYDYIGSLGLLQESYSVMKPIILINEKKNDILKTFHLEFKESLLRLPENISKMEKFNEFNCFERKDLLKILEGSWSRFREILSFN